MTSIPALNRVSAGRWSSILFAGLCVVAFTARLVGIDSYFDEDEVFSAQLASGTLKRVLIESLIDKPHPPLYNILLHFWLSIGGMSETYVRLLSVLLAVGAISIYFCILRARVRMVAAASATLVMSLSGFLIYYGQEARPYALISLIGAANLLTFLRVLQAPRDRYKVLAWAASALALVYSQYFGAVYLLVEGIILLISMPAKTALRALALAVLMSFSVLPWMWTAFHLKLDMSQIAWIHKPELRSLPDFFIGTVGWPPHTPGWLLLAALTALFVLGFALCLRSGRLSLDVAVFASVALMPPCIAFVLSDMVDFSIWAPRQLITSAFAFIVLIAIFVDSLPLAARRFAAAALVIWAAAGAVDGFTTNRVAPYKDIFERIRRDSSNPIILAEESWTLLPLRFYGRELNIQIFDLRSSKLTFQIHSYYYVCRPNFCQYLAMLERHFDRPTETMRFPFGTAGGEMRHEVFVYHFVSHG